MAKLYIDLAGLRSYSGNVKTYIDKGYETALAAVNGFKTRIEAAEAKIGTVPTDKTVVGLISELDTAVKANATLIGATTDTAAADTLFGHIAAVDAQNTALNDKIGDITADGVGGATVAAQLGALNTAAGTASTAADTAKTAAETASTAADTAKTAAEAAETQAKKAVQNITATGKTGNFDKDADGVVTLGSAAGATVHDGVIASATGTDVVTEGQVVDYVAAQTADLAGTVMHFKGVVTELPTDNSEAGDIVLLGTKEYVYNGTAWVELGDETVLGSIKDAIGKTTDTAADGTLYARVANNAADIEAANTKLDGKIDNVTVGGISVVSGGVAKLGTAAALPHTTSVSPTSTAVPTSNAVAVYIDTRINELDGTGTQEATSNNNLVADGLELTATVTDGKVTAINGKIDTVTEASITALCGELFPVTA